MKSAFKYKMPNEMTLPSAECIRKTNPDEAAIKQNMALLDYNDKLSGSENESESKKMTVEATASI